MKKQILLLSITFLSFLSVTAQKSNLIFFTDNGEKFTVILNSISQNTNPETNVKITDLPAPNYKVRIIFDDPFLQEFDKNIVITQGTETTFIIKKNKKGKYVIRFMNEISLAQAPPPPTGQTVIVYTATPPVTTTITQTQTKVEMTEGTGDNQTGNNISMEININEAESGMNVNLGVNNTNQTTTYTTTQTSTTITETNLPPAPPPPTQNLYGYNGPIGCSHPMLPDDFNLVKQSIKSKDFEDSKITIAKQVIDSNCLLSSQVKEIMLLFDFEDTRLELAKYAYGYTYDIGNYYQLNDAFDFESSINELNEFINSYTW